MPIIFGLGKRSNTIARPSDSSNEKPWDIHQSRLKERNISYIHLFRVMLNISRSQQIDYHIVWLSFLAACSALLLYAQGYIVVIRVPTLEREGIGVRRSVYYRIIPRSTIAKSILKDVERLFLHN